MIHAFITKLSENNEIRVLIVEFALGKVLYNEFHPTAQDSFDFVTTNYPGAEIYSRIEYKI